MGIDAISPYQTNTGNTARSTGGKNLSMDDFFKLMVTQLSNQSIYNSVDDTQFITQMAQYSMVQALSDLSEASATAYSVSLIGKEATVAKAKDDGSLETLTGIVESVTLYNGSPQISIDGNKYDLSSVMEVREPKIIIPKNDLEGEDSGTDGGDIPEEAESDG